MRRKLYRNQSDKILGGVASGLADYLDVDVTIIRIVFILMALFGLSGVLIYIILWIAVPLRGGPPFTADYRVREDLNTGGTSAEPDYREKYERPGNGRLIAGIILVVLGAYFLASEFHFIPFWFSLHKLWPLIFIIPGILILSNSRRRRRVETPEQEAGTPTDQVPRDISNQPPKDKPLDTEL